MATKKHKRRKRDTRTQEQKEQSARDLAQQTSAAESPKKDSNATLSKSKSSTAAKAKTTKSVVKSTDKNKKPSLWTRFVNYCKAVKGEMQRVVWPTRPELINASLIVVGALVFFGVGIAIIDNIIILPLDGISSLGVKADG